MADQEIHVPADIATDSREALSGLGPVERFVTAKQTSSNSFGHLRHELSSLYFMRSLVDAERRPTRNRLPGDLIIYLHFKCVVTRIEAAQRNGDTKAGAKGDGIILSVIGQVV